ncbi:MAG TPA: methylated-DNA--[protein]-cysteine S-methyltransferase [Alphaproteobacteria bacterium]|nr:methylated-DNA--[protein]-cysteine S-methyltransferase [Alphaproteobacteria bacterium]
MKSRTSLQSPKLKLAFQLKPPRLVRWGFHPSPYTPLMIGLTEDGLLCRVEFTRKRKAALVMKDWAESWPDTEFVLDKKATGIVAQAILRGRPLPRILMTGTRFQQDVWKTILEIPQGEVISYAEVAKRINRPRAVRAVGSACGANPVPLVVPCHRVVGSNGRLGGFGSSLDLKVKLLNEEGVRNYAA